MYLASFILQTATGAAPAAGAGDAATPGAGGSPLSSLIMFGGIIVIFYFFMIRPQQRRAKEETKFREGLKKGDKVVTLGGIFGRVISVEDDSLFIEIDQNVKIQVKKAAVSADPSVKKDTK
jgi:preprotein translocase subunit YajC